MSTAGSRFARDDREMGPFGYVRRNGAARLSGGEEQTLSAMSAYAQYARLLSLQMWSIS
jgi:hypothetical protein